ncbi:MAG: hypothetical protein C0594_03535 [Marinilabiliales bacterium]|nr:MAG: hypothetical protein C0594_03535 [Marinilabiliales bacterium]
MKMQNKNYGGTYRVDSLVHYKYDSTDQIFYWYESDKNIGNIILSYDESESTNSCNYLGIETELERYAFKSIEDAIYSDGEIFWFKDSGDRLTFWYVTAYSTDVGEILLITNTDDKNRDIWSFIYNNGLVLIKEEWYVTRTSD